MCQQRTFAASPISAIAFPDQTYRNQIEGYCGQDGGSKCISGPRGTRVLGTLGDQCWGHAYLLADYATQSGKEGALQKWFFRETLQSRASLATSTAKLLGVKARFAGTEISAWCRPTPVVP